MDGRTVTRPPGPGSVSLPALSVPRTQLIRLVAVGVVVVLPSAVPLNEVLEVANDSIGKVVTQLLTVLQV